MEKVAKFKCDICGKEYQMKSWYEKHLKTHKKSKPEIEIERIEEKNLPEEEKMEEMFNAIREFQSGLKKIDETKQSISFNVEGDFIAVLFLSDLHLGNVNVNFEYIDKLINFVKNHERAFAVLNGDLIDNWVRLSPAGGEYEQTINPELQQRVINYKLEPIKDKMLAIIKGNHEERSERQGDENPARAMARKFDVAYLGAGGRLNLNFNGFIYKLHIRHRFRYESSFNPCHACGRLIEQLDSEADIVGIGHKHDPAIEVRFKAGKQRSLLRFGAAIPATSYSKALGYDNTPLVAPTVVLSGVKKAHHPFIDISIVEKYIEKVDK